MKQPRNGPHGYFSEDADPSRGQWQAIAQLALELLGEPPPATRLAASQTIGTLRASLDPGSPPSTVPASKPSSRTTGAPSSNGARTGNGAASPPAVSSGVSAASASSRARRTGARTAATTPTEGG